MKIHPNSRPLRVALLGACMVTTVAGADPAWIGEARSVATSVPPRLLEVLKAEIDKGGPEGAIAACRDEAPKLARAASERTGWQVRRVSLKNRNPRAVPDAWEAAVLQDFDRRAAAGENPMTLERAEEVTENGQTVRRYMRALPVQELCVSCHGPADQLKPAVTATLKALYPDDRGIGYSVGQIRGAMTIRRAP
jgi:Protein of unknown function (DUF3365)